MYEFIRLPAKINQLVESANKLGDPTLPIELDETALQDMSDQQFEIHLATLALIAKVQKQVYNISLQLIATYEISGAAAGYAGGKVIDTNENPSDLKTWATLFVSSWVGNGVGGLLSSLLVNQEIKGLESDKSLSAQIDETLNNLNELTAMRKKEGLSAYPPEFELAAKEVGSLLIKITATLAALRTLTGLAAAYHGFKRNGDNLGYALAWGTTGFFSGSTSLGLALEQGYAKPL